MVLDLDGVIVHSEHLWERGWQTCSARRGTRWGPEDTTTVQGMSAPEWARYLAERVGAPDDAEKVRAECVADVVRAVEEGEAPLLPGADTLVAELSARVPVGLASSAARPVIDAVLHTHALHDHFTATVSSEEVERGKPQPDVYLAASHAIGIPAQEGLAMEDSGNGIRAAHAAGLWVVAIPNPDYPPGPDALRLADHIAADHRDALAHALAHVRGCDSDHTRSAPPRGEPAARNGAQP
ncbi:HAD family phosphatase [Spiractinospora alimapuensis]|nr:HAD family phosphatase [Spiractinospora alimapuensis]